ncbi:MAG: hypothetical protein KAJ19_22775 [Gammaproteobacteria bacterium]|nr:hypothetical protein [Gammaproteobacteria bacterium]
MGYIETNDYENSRVNYTNWNNVTIKENFPRVFINMLSPMPDPPQLRIYNNGTTVILDWTPPGTPDISHYLIYRSTARDNFDFRSPWVDTNVTMDNIGLDIIAGRTTWNDTTASTSSEYYYIIRTVNSEGITSFTSNTVGKFDRYLPTGTSTFSLPLEPSYQRNVSWYIEQIGSDPTDYIKWWNPGTQTWVTHLYSDGEGINDAPVNLGEGYEMGLALDRTYSFWGKPASSIRYLEGEMPRLTNFAVTVDTGGNVQLTWDELAGADHYIIYRTTSRDGLNVRSLSFAAEVPFGTTTWIDSNPGINIGGNEFYYMVGAANSSSMHFTYNTTYAIGVWIADYPAGYSSFGLPLKTMDAATKTIDEYADDIPNTVGINYFIYGEQRWAWHRFNMPMGVYDEVMGYSNGYQISTSALSGYYFVGR